MTERAIASTVLSVVSAIIFVSGLHYGFVLPAAVLTFFGLLAASSVVHGTGENDD